MIQQCMTTSFRKELLLGVHNFSATGGDTFKISLYSDSATLNSTTTAYTSTGEVSGTGYTAGGATLTNVDPASAGTVGYTTFATVTWSATLTARGALIYNSSESNKSVMVLDFGMDRSSTGGVFTITFPTANQTTAIIRLT